MSNHVSPIISYMTPTTIPWALKKYFESNIDNRMNRAKWLTTISPTRRFTMPSFFSNPRQMVPTYVEEWVFQSAVRQQDEELCEVRSQLNAIKKHLNIELVHDDTPTTYIVEKKA
jgi:hypothetical protein